MRIAQYLVWLLMLVIVRTATAEVALHSHDAVYKVRIGVISGQLSTTLRQTDAGYVAHHVIKPKGMIRALKRGEMDVTSAFSTSDHGVRAVNYRAVDTLRGDPDIDLRFDWATREAVGTVGDADVALQLDRVAHDSVSIQYALMHDLLSGKPAEQYALFDVDKMRVVNVSDAGVKEVKTPYGEFTAIGVNTQREGSSRITTMWCVEELGYLPVIIEQTRKGKLKFRASLTKYKAVK